MSHHYPSVCCLSSNESSAFQLLWVTVWCWCCDLQLVCTAITTSLMSLTYYSNLFGYKIGLWVMSCSLFNATVSLQCSRYTPIFHFIHIYLHLLKHWEAFYFISFHFILCPDSLVCHSREWEITRYIFPSPPKCWPPDFTPVENGGILTAWLSSE